MRRRKSEKEQKKLADDARLMRWWHAWHREQRVEALVKYPILEELLRLIDHLELAQPVQVLGLARAIDWSAVDANVRFVVIHEFNSAVTKLRTKRDLEPIDDGLGGHDQSETPFRALKAILFPPPQEGAHRGEARAE